MSYRLDLVLEDDPRINDRIRSSVFIMRAFHSQIDLSKFKQASRPSQSPSGKPEDPQTNKSRVLTNAEIESSKQ